MTARNNMHPMLTKMQMFRLRTFSISVSSLSPYRTSLLRNSMEPLCIRMDWSV